MMVVLSSFDAFVRTAINVKKMKRIRDESPMFVCEEHERLTAEVFDDYLRNEGNTILQLKTERKEIESKCGAKTPKASTNQWELEASQNH
jgi:hypothetical protein